MNPQLVELFRATADALQNAQERPYGPAVSPSDRSVAGEACVALCAGNHDKARTLWKLISADCGGYMPHSAAVALIRASNTENLVPDIEAPVPQ